ncbi:hypothetical protein D0859_12025 [Hortaea werneckii]|uniref:AIG1-type G domain-containing protein n=1 Tax=Hortaea werneckii TaxID=91943 RepID=A0A3M7IF48_HORWE|nr:hypothetical protein D0859_12025 [Hortaea werneckii]
MTDAIIKELDMEETKSPLILVIGQTGAGKSHFINKTIGDKVVKESSGLKSCTSKPEMVEVQVDEHQFLMIDTPGFNDTRRDTVRSDATILAEIARMLTLQTQLGVQLVGCPASRMTGDTLRQLEMIKRICGEHCYSNIMLVMTHWPKSLADQKANGCAVKEKDLRTEFWRDLVRGGSIMKRFDNESISAQAIVRTFAGKQNIVTSLQEQLAQGLKLSQTSAGSFIADARRAEEIDASPKSSQERERLERWKKDEEKLPDDIVHDVRKDIKDADSEARNNKRIPTVALILRWLISVSALAMGVSQVALQVE